MPVRTFDGWDDPPPGFVEADLVAHSGPIAKGSFVQTLVLTDIATGWTECAPLLVREQRLLTEVLSEMRKLLPFALLGFDTDNDSVFMNETVRDYCQQAGIWSSRAAVPIARTTRRGSSRRTAPSSGASVGYRRFEGLEAAAALARLYAALRLFVNFFQPSFKLAAKSRDGAKVTKRYHPPATPLSAAVGGCADERGGPAPRGRRCARHWTRFVCCSRSARPSRSSSDLPTRPSSATRCRLLRRRWSNSCLGCAQHGRKARFARPAQPKPKAKRLRRRPDPFVAVTTDAAGMVRGGAVAHIARTVRAAADRVSRRLSGWAAANMPASTQGMAARGRPSIGIRDRAGRCYQPGQQARMPGCDVGDWELPCGFDSTLGRRWGVAHNSTGSTTTNKLSVMK